MAETQAIEIDAAVKFVVRGHEFLIDPVEACVALDDILAGLGKDGLQKDYLRQFGAWLKEQPGGIDELSLGELEVLSIRIRGVREQKKREAQDAFDITPR